MIHLLNSWYLDSDGNLNIALLRKNAEKPGRKKESTKGDVSRRDGYRIIGYYQSVDSALKDWIDRLDMEILDDPEVVEFTEGIRMLRASRDQVDAVIRKALKDGK
jgi:hypothetical protein